jgi:hypothetical protein
MTQRLNLNLVLGSDTVQNEAFITELDLQTSSVGFVKINQGDDFAFYQAEFLLGVDPVQVFGLFAGKVQDSINTVVYTDEIILTRNSYEVIYNS